MEKKLLYNSSSVDAQPYTPRDFDAPEGGAIKPEPPILQEEAAPEHQISEEERIMNLEQEAKRSGFEQGRSDGYAAGLANGKGEVEASLQKIQGIIEQLDRFRETKLAELQPEIMELSIEIAKKIVHKEIELDRDVILSITEDAIAKAGSKGGEIVIKINPLDYEVMITNIDHLKESSGLKNIAIEPSAAISQGGCYIETPAGEVDARYEEQVKEIEDAIVTATSRKM